MRYSITNFVRELQDHGDINCHHLTIDKKELLKWKFGDSCTNICRKLLGVGLLPAYFKFTPSVLKMNDFFIYD